MNLDSASLSIIAAPLLAGVLVTITHVPMGREVLKRGIIFIDLAVAQIAGLGVILALMLDFNMGDWQTQLIAVVAALLGAALIGGFERWWPNSQEALIGSTFVMAATASLLLLAGDPHAGEHMTDLLAGQLLWVDSQQLLPVAAVYGVVLLLWSLLGPGRLRFYLLFAVTVTVSVQLVGVYLVFSSLIIPALAVRRLQGFSAILAGCLIGVLAFAAGLLCSLWFDWPAGPAVVWMLAFFGVLFGFTLGAQRGVANAN
ncbi:metal ABC transporter permease [Gammaproteobacteria bacterium]|nr:metal ABC transporter permease [Gammaproteobacteria bacterium]